jgi:predicted Zn-dependent protease
VERLLVKGRDLHKLGIEPKALQVLDHLAHFHHLPELIARETRRRLAMLYCKRKKFRRARRLLASLVVAEPHESRYHYLLGKATAVDVRCDPRQALRQYRRCLNLEPRNPRYLSSFAVLAVRTGREQLGLRLLRRAFRLAPEDAVVLRRYLRSLRELHRVQEARRVLRQCRFRLGKLPWFQDLLSDFQFFVLQLRQRKQRRQRRLGQEQQLRLLPFPTVPERATPHDEADTIRTDGPAVLPVPHLSLARRRPDQRHAQ